MIRSGIVWNFLLWSLLIGASNARECGTAITDECKSRWDRRYEETVSTDLTNLASNGGRAWQRINGLYRGTIYTYDPDYSLSRKVDGEDVLYPTYTFLNITVSGTRVYRHKWMFRIGSELPPLEGQDGFFLIGWQDQCDSVGIATWEKDGIAQNLRTVCRSDTDDPEELTASSTAYPIERFGVQFDEVFVPNGQTGTIAKSTTVKCVSVSCPAITLIDEVFQGGQRTGFEMGELVKLSEEQFKEEVNAAPTLYNAGEANAAFVPTVSGCLSGRCYTDRQICAAGDPSEFCRENYPGDFSASPYQNDDEDVKPGVVAALTIFSILFVMFIIFVAYLFAKRAQNARARYFFAHRMSEVMQVDKPMDKFTARDIMSEYKALEDRLKGEIDEDKMYEFLSTGKLGYMDWGEFNQLWANLDQAGCGKVSFLGFCAFMGHSWKEFEEIRAERVQSEGPTTE